ncbi:MAG: glycosyltransferase family 4 protein [Opitutales bacterium]|nr:glycosyltransferase family 4 protein [Opitutales bacterium]
MEEDKAQIIIPNLNPRFSGITSTIIAVVPEQQKELDFAGVGYFIDKRIRHISWREFFRLSSRPLKNGKNRIFHCRRNIEMVYGLIFKYILRRKITLIFTSTAQRKHTWLTKFLYKRMDGLLTTSPRAASFLVRKPDAIIPHGTNPEIYFPIEDKRALRAELGLENEHSIGIFGRVREQKGVREFVEAMCEILPKHPEYNAVIVGQTTPKFVPFENEMKQLIKDAGLSSRFQWLGKVEFEKIPKLFRAMDLVCAVSRNEGFGLTCLEAMASGVPVIATKTGGFDMVIREDSDGHIIPCNDAKALAKALDISLSDPEKLRRMGKNSRERILSSFTISKEASAINAVYKKFLGLS